MSEAHEPGKTYLRLRISPKAIKEVAEVGGKVAETAIGLNSIRVGMRIKKVAEQQAKISRTLQAGKNVAEISVGIATAISKLIQ